MKYRIVQKGDQYNPQYKGWLFWYKVKDYSDDIKWVSKIEACRIVADWERQDAFNALPEIVCEPEDICKGE